MIVRINSDFKARLDAIEGHCGWLMGANGAKLTITRRTLRAPMAITISQIDQKYCATFISLAGGAEVGEGKNGGVNAWTTTITFFS